MNNEYILKSVIDKYKLSEPLPVSARISMEKSRKKNLVKILRKDARRALFITAVVSFFLWIKKFGVSISIVKSAVAVSAVLIIGAGVITFVGVYSINKLVHHISNETVKIENTKSLKMESAGNPAAVSQEILSYAMAVSPVEMDDVSDSLLSKYTNKIILELRNINGAQAAIKADKLDKYHLSDKILSISIIKLDEKSQTSGSDKSAFRISAKIVNTVNSRVLMYTSVIADGEDAIPDSLLKLAEKIPVKF